jgi:cytochrome oxidase Cu insertion factor (SCO1/SenC/PrrC family)
MVMAYISNSMEFQKFFPSRLHILFAAAALALALVLGGTALYVARGGADKGIGTALIGGPFTLTNQDGKPVTDKDLLGKHALIFFGYTYCPDVCPTELQVMSAALQQMGQKADEIRPVFISVDPERDTPEAIKAYVSNFDSRFIGLTGTPEQVAQAARAYRVYYAKVANQRDPGSYLMDHSSILYLMGPDGRFLKHFAYTTDAAALAKDLESAMQQ